MTKKFKYHIKGLDKKQIRKTRMKILPLMNYKIEDNPICPLCGHTGTSQCPIERRQCRLFRVVLT